MFKLKSLIVLLSALAITACSALPDVNDYLPDQRLEYKKQKEAQQDLEVPPDLVAGKFDDAMDIPSLSGSATYSEYVGERQKRHQMASSGEVLPEFKAVTLQREGDNRWLEVKATPQQVWPRLVAFWREQGILLVEQDPTTGVMKTNWLENRAEIRKDFITNVLRKVVDGLYETSTRDQYRVRVEPGVERGTTDIYLTHRGMEEKLVRNTVGEDANTVWEPGPSDPGKEALMLRRLMVYLGATEQRAQRVLAEGAPAQTTAGSSRLVQGPAGQTELLIPQDFPQAWRLTGLALDRVGFAVQDKDRTQGIYYVRYDDPSKAEEKKGFFSKLAFWRSNDINTVTQYRVKLTPEGDHTRVAVLNQAGQPETSATGKRILTLLQHEIG
jgi:outer membrane protein assembly factor BamC